MDQILSQQGRLFGRLQSIYESAGPKGKKASGHSTSASSSTAASSAPKSAAVSSSPASSPAATKPATAATPAASPGSTGTDLGLDYVKARALYDFAAEEANELSFREGDTVTVLAKHMDGWWKGELNGKQGLFPSTYVEEIPTDLGPASASKPVASAVAVTPTPSSPAASPAPARSVSPSDSAPAATTAASEGKAKLLVTAEYDYAAGEDNELSFREGDVISVLENNGEWWKGELNGEVGLFPANYVAIKN